MTLSSLPAAVLRAPLDVNLGGDPEPALDLGDDAPDDAVSDLATGKLMRHGTEKIVAVGNVEHAGGAHHGGKFTVGKRNRRHGRDLVIELGRVDI